MNRRYSPVAPPAATTATLPPPEARLTTPPPVTQPGGVPSSTLNPPSSPPKVSGLKKLSLGGIKPKADTKTAYPVLPDPNGQLAIIAERIIKNSQEFDALKGALETDKADLKTYAAPFYFTVNSRRHEVPSSIAVNSPAGEVLVTFQNRYSLLPDEGAVQSILGDETAKYFRQSLEVKIKSDLLPEDKAQELLDKMAALFAEYGAENALEVKAGVKPTAEFHAARHLALSPEQNLALESACPIVAMVKTKGRR